MKTVTRKIDKLGRIVLPIDCRKKLGIENGSEVFIEANEDTIIIKGAFSLCRICGSSLREKNRFSLCKNCVEKIKKCDFK